MVCFEEPETTPDDFAVAMIRPGRLCFSGQKDGQADALTRRIF